MLRLTKSIELLVRQAAAQDLLEPDVWLENLIMPVIGEKLSPDAIELAFRKQIKNDLIRHRWGHLTKPRMGEESL